MPRSAPPSAPASAASSDAAAPVAAQTAAAQTAAAQTAAAQTAAAQTVVERARALRELVTSPLAGLGFLSRAWAAIPVVELSLRVLGYRRTVSWIEAVPRSRAGGSGASVGLGQRLVRGAYRGHAFRGGCLPEALVQYLLHRRDGTGARFVIGVHRVPPPRPRAANETRPPGIEAHAWIEAPDLAPPAARKFAPIFHSGSAR